jgi:hypothetical protein
MSHEIAKTPIEPTQFPDAAHKHARRALREHQRAEQDALNAVQHAVKSGQALLKAYDLCEYGQWKGFFEMHFQQDKDSWLSPRTAASFPGPLRLLGKVPGGRAREGSLHKRLANFHIGGEWFHLTVGVRAVVAAVIADQAE